MACEHCGGKSGATDAGIENSHSLSYFPLIIFTMDWHCPCGTRNEDDLDRCRSCGRALFQSAGQHSSSERVRLKDDPSHYLACKICERGVLAKRNLFRMSGPVVVIGFILLIPSVAGMLFSAVVLFWIVSGSANVDATKVTAEKQQIQDIYAALDQYHLDVGTFPSQADGLDALRMAPAPPTDTMTKLQSAQTFAAGKDYPTAESIYRQILVTEPTNVDAIKGLASVLYREDKIDEAVAALGTLDRISAGVHQWHGPYLVSSLRNDPWQHPYLYEYAGRDERPRITSLGPDPNGSGTPALAVFGSGLTVVFGISCFVGGLLGWILTMRKRVLQCSDCGATISAS